MTDDPELIALTRDIIDENRYLVLGTIDAEGRAWLSPLSYAALDYREFLWASRPDAEHSRNIDVRPRVTIVFFDSSVEPGAASAVYVTGTAEMVNESLLQSRVEIYSRRSQTQGLPEWTVEDVQSPSAHRLYRTVATEYFVLKPDGVDERISVDAQMVAAATAPNGR